MIEIREKVGGVVAAIGLGVILVLMALSPIRSAQAGDLDVTKLRPSPHVYDVMTVKFLDFPSTVSGAGGVFVHYGQNQLVYLTPDGPQAVVKDRVTADFYGSLAFSERFSLGLLIPGVLVNKGEMGFAQPIDSGSGIGDIGLSMKGAILKRGRKGFGLGLALDAKFATGRERAHLSDGGTVVLTSLVADTAFHGYRAALNLGYRIRDTYEEEDGLFSVGNELDIRFAFEAPLVRNEIGLFGQVASTTGTSGFYGDPNTNYFEVGGGLSYQHSSGMRALIGGGGGLAKGYGNVRVRAFLGLAYYPSVRPPDSDSDGVLDAVDQCPNRAEDMDQYEDHDGCPEPDNDGDSILDGDDKCPVDPEDVDGFKDKDGCPEFDNDADGLTDKNDLCPDEAEDFDQFEDSDGCPDEDNDEDGIPDDKDACPQEAENKNDHKDDDGCPDEAPLAELRDGKLIVRGQVVFRGATAKLDRSSRPVLDAVSAVLKGNPGITQVEILVTTGDEVVARRANRRSASRARKIADYLIRKGVPSGQVVAKGGGAGDSTAVVFTILGSGQ
ncbi:MAG: hypothetical protein CMH54_12865 [Myxococcales bacterium]|nr:hypothetical protein [Myxococcales bacterium]|tara:strand:+ start:1444 stop:3102 length:1659 start_codon:yes stop_codon:yes gene_type:complete